ncbi:MAG: cupin domain-containing protein [Thermoleophilia bacterium]|nr:cupin domain-containing protein [Thermoleophilia bacterium]
MHTWNLVDYDVEPQKPQILGTTKEGRAVLVNLPAGDSMPDHQVRERATVVVILGRIEITTEDGETINGGTGTMVVFEPSERHSLVAHEDSRFLLLLAPWSLDEHSSLQPWSRETP